MHDGISLHWSSETEPWRFLRCRFAQLLALNTDDKVAKTMSEEIPKTRLSIHATPVAVSLV